MADNKIVFRGVDGVFLNSQSIFCEYHDIIKSPYFLFLNLIVENLDQFSKFVNIDELEGLELESLCELYYARKHQNILMEILKPELKGKISITELDNFINHEIGRIDTLVGRSPLLAMGHVIEELIRDKKNCIVKKVIIYNRYYNKMIEDDLQEIFNDRIEFMYGELSDVLEKVPHDSTYVFSDITNIITLAECDKLNYASILIPSEYSYNKNSDGEYLIKIDEYMKEYLFKLDFFNALEYNE